MLVNPMDASSNASAGGSECTSCVKEELCDYEVKRLENIKMNQDMMKALGNHRANSTV